MIMFLQTTKIDWQDPNNDIILDNCGTKYKIQLKQGDVESLQRLITSGELQTYICDIYSCLPLVKTAVDFEQLEMQSGYLLNCQGQSQNKILNKQELVKQAIRKFKKEDEEENQDNNLALSSLIKVDLNPIIDVAQNGVFNQQIPVDENTPDMANNQTLNQIEEAEQQVEQSFVQLYSIDPSMIQEQINTYLLNKKIVPNKDICETIKHAKLAAYSDDIIYESAEMQRFTYQQLQSLTPFQMLQENNNIDRESMFSCLYNLQNNINQLNQLSQSIASQVVSDFVLPLHEKSQFMNIYPSPSDDIRQTYNEQLQWFKQFQTTMAPQILETKMLQLGPVYASLLLSNKIQGEKQQQFNYVTNSTLSTQPLALTRLDLFDNGQFETGLTTSKEVYPIPVNPCYDVQCGNIKVEMIVQNKKQVNEIRTNDSDCINDEYQRISCQSNKQQEIISYLGHNCCVTLGNGYEEELQYGFNDDQLFVDNRQDKTGYCKPHIIFVDQLHSSSQSVFTNDYDLEGAYSAFIQDLEVDKKFVLSQFFAKFRQQIIQGLKQLKQNQIHMLNDQRVPVVTNLSALTIIKNNKIQNWQSFLTTDINTQLLTLVKQSQNAAYKMGIQYHMSFASLSQDFLKLIDQDKLNPDCNSKQFAMNAQQIATMEKMVLQTVQNNQVAIESLYPYIVAKIQQIQNQQDLIDQVKVCDIYHQKWLKFVAIKLEEAYHQRNLSIDQIISVFNLLHIQEFYWYEIAQLFNDKVFKQQVKTILAGYFAGLQLKYLMRKISYEAQQFGLKPQRFQRQVHNVDENGNEQNDVITEQLYWWYGKQMGDEIVSCKPQMYLTALKTLIVDYINKLYSSNAQQWQELQLYINNNFNFMTKSSETVTPETIFCNQYQLKYLFLQQIIDTVGIQFQSYITTQYFQQNQWKLCTTDIYQFKPKVLQNEWSQIQNQVSLRDDLLNIKKQILCQFTEIDQINANQLINDKMLMKEKLEYGFQHNNLFMNVKQFILGFNGDKEDLFNQIPFLMNNLWWCDNLYIEHKLNMSLLNIDQLVENIKFETVLNMLMQSIARQNPFSKIMELKAVEINQQLVDHINSVVKDIKNFAPSVDNNQIITRIMNIAKQNVRINQKTPLAICKQCYIENSIEQIYFICQKVEKLVQRENYMTAASLIEMYLEDWISQNLGLPLVQIICILAGIYSKMGRHTYAIEIYKQALNRLQQLIEEQRNLIVYYAENVPEQQLWQTTNFIQKQEGNKFILTTQNLAQKLFIIRAQLVNNICKTACKAYAFSFLGDLIGELKNMLTLFQISNQTQIISNIITDMLYTIAKTYELMQKNNEAIIYYEMILKTKVIIEISQNIHWQAFKQLFSCILKMKNQNVTVVQNKIIDMMQTHYIVLKRPEIESVLRDILSQQDVTQYIISLYDSVQQQADLESARKLILLQCYLRGDSIEEIDQNIQQEKDDDSQQEQQEEGNQIQDVTAQEVAQQVVQD